MNCSDPSRGKSPGGVSYPSLREPSLLKTVLIIDNDLGFVFWLGHLLDQHEYLALPARSVSDAALLILQLDLQLDLLIMNPDLMGGLDFLSAVRRSHRDVRVIAVIDDPEKPVAIHGLDGVVRKANVFDEAAQAEWIACVQQVLAARNAPAAQH